MSSSVPADGASGRQVFGRARYGREVLQVLVFPSSYLDFLAYSDAVLTIAHCMHPP